MCTGTGTVSITVVVVGVEFRLGLDWALFGMICSMEIYHDIAPDGGFPGALGGLIPNGKLMLGLDGT